MNVTVILCTYNRCQSLAKALESVLASDVPESVSWEVVVADNNSRDETRAVAEEFISRYPGRVRYIFEPRQGKSHALNSGIRESKASVLAFMDDDVTVDLRWLKNLTQPLLDNDCVGTAGRILLGDFVPPSWLAIRGPHDLGGSLVQFDLGEEQIVLERAPFGASMAFQKSLFEKFGGFRTDLGRSGKSLIGNEDTEFGMRLITAGLRLLYVPSAIVYHPVFEERLTKKYFRSYWYGLGRSLVRERGEQFSFWMVPRAYVAEFRRRLRWMSMADQYWYRSAQGRFYCEVHALQALGQIIEGWSRLTRRQQRLAKNSALSKPDLTR
jgi:glycosyltransferase involved in cell wall biosynthesis